ncbi:hypothetical protein BH10ACI2_BH10ACI2_00010 [soil metagenome]
MSLPRSVLRPGRSVFRCLWATVLIVSVTLSSFAATPDAVKATYDTLAANMKYAPLSTGPTGNDFLTFFGTNSENILPALLPGLLKRGRDSKKKSDTKTQIDRIEIKPANITVTQGQAVSYSSTAFGGDKPIGGVNFTWSVIEEGKESNKYLTSNGVFSAIKPGRFVVRATANGQYAETEITVKANSHYGDQLILQKNESNLTDAERQKINEWKAAGTLTTRTNSSKKIYSIAKEKALAKADLAKLEKARQSALKTQAETEKATGGKSGSGPMVNGTVNDQNSAAGSRRQGGPSAEEDNSRAVESAPKAAPMRLYSMDPIEWDSSNWSTADDPGSNVGHPAGSAPDAGAATGNFTLSTPAVNLSGRGIDVNLNLNYNSKLWSKWGSSDIAYNADAGYPAPGWSLGFGQMYYLESTGGCMLVRPDSTKQSYDGSHYIYAPGGYYQDTYTGHTTDGSFIDYQCTLLGTVRWS